METIALTIDGQKLSCPPGATILEAAERHGIKIPNLCFHPELKPFGACRLCLVEDAGTGRLMASCVTPAAADMVVLTSTPRILKHRRTIVRLMIAEHPESCIVCSKGNRCRLRQVAAELGIGETRLYPMPNFKPLEQANPFIIRDLSKCILCGKCIRADHEVVVVGAIDYNLRGFRCRPATAHDLALEHSSCTFCGTCVSMCPTGALAPKLKGYVGTPQHELLSICGFCSVGCRLAIGVADGKVVEINPADRPDSVNRSALCVRGHFGHDFLNSGKRLTEPLVRADGNRRDGQWKTAAWNEVLDLVAERLLKIKREDGPQSIAFLGSTKCSNEENYLFQKIARVALETHNVDSNGYGAGQPLMSRLDSRTHGRLRVGPLDGLEKAQAIFVLGADPNHSAPVVSYFLKRAARKGIPLLVADPRRTELASFSKAWLRVAPAKDVEMINGLAALLLQKGFYDSAFIDRTSEGFSVFRYGLASLSVERAAHLAGLSRQSLEDAADLLKGKKIAFIIGNGLLQQPNGAHALDALLNLALMTGSFGCEGAGLYVLAKENNQIGAWDMGAVPNGLAGRMRLADPAARKIWENAWRIKISPDPGLNMVRMIEEAEKGNLKALYVMGENPLRSLPQPERVKKALEKLDFIVVQDILAGETSQIADVILPGSASAEKGGSFTNLEGRIQTFEAASRPPGNARPDWRILAQLAAKLGFAQANESLEEIRAEIRQYVPMYADLGLTEQAWVKADGHEPTGHGADGPAKMAFSAVVSTPEAAADSHYPFTAIFGSWRYHLGCGTRTGFSERIEEFGLKGEIELCMEDARSMNLKAGDQVRISSRHGTVGRAVRIGNSLSPAMVFIPKAVNGNDAMNLVALSDLAKPDSPGWKMCRVRIEKV